MKTYEIIFDDNFEDDDKAVGVYGISLVNTPAIEVEALMLSSDEPSKYEWTQERIDALLKLGKSPLKYDKNYVLVHNEEVTFDEKEFEELNLSSEDNDLFKVRYSYDGGLQSNSRTFCRLLVGENREFDIDEIHSLDTLNDGFGPNGSNRYSILFYKGGVNCKHRWIRKFYFFTGNKKGLTQFEALQELKKRKVTITPNMIRRADPKESQIASAENNYWRLNLSADKKLDRTLTSPVLIPNKRLYRRNFKGGEAQIFANAETIKKLSQNFFIKNNIQTSTYDHVTPIDGVTVVESWIVNNPEKDKSSELGFDVPAGTWMVSLKLSEDTWEEYIENGDVKGLSIDSLMRFKEVEEVAPIKLKNEQKTMLKKDLLKSIKEKALVKLNLADESVKTMIDSELGLHVDGIFEVGKILLDETGGHTPDFRFTYEGIEYKTNSEGVIELYKEEEEIKEEVIELSSDEAGEIVEELADIVAEVVAENAINDAELVAELEAKILELEAKIVELEKELETKKGEVEVKEEEIVNLKKETPKPIGFKGNPTKNGKETFEQKIKRLSGK